MASRGEKRSGDSCYIFFIDRYMYQHLLKQSKHDVWIIVSISLMMTLIFWVIVYTIFMDEYAVKKNSNCYKETQNIFCYDEIIGYRLGWSENENTWRSTSIRGDLPLSVTFGTWLLLSLYMLILSWYAYVGKYYHEIDIQSAEVDES